SLARGRLMRVHPPRAPESIGTSPPAMPPQAESWGAQQTRALARRWPRAFRMAALLWRAAAWFGPPLVVAVTLILLARVHYFAQHFDLGPGVAGYAEINRVSAKQLGIQRIEVQSDIGYDGQFYYFVAYRPSIIVTCPHDPATCPT